MSDKNKLISYKLKVNPETSTEGYFVIYGKAKDPNQYVILPNGDEYNLSDRLALVNRITELKAALRALAYGRDPFQQFQDGYVECSYCGGSIINFKYGVDKIQHADDCEIANAWQLIESDNNE